MARARVEQHPATGTTMVVMVGLGMAFLLFMSFLNVVKSGNILSEANLLFAALVFYAGAGALYLGFGVTGTDSYIKFASLMTWAGLLANTGAVAHRWYEAGHPPFASIYEMLLSFVWTLAALTLIAEKRYGVKVIGTVTMPVAIVGVILMQLLPSDVRPLVPALQSTWLHVHVTLAMLAYAACALSFALAMMFLIQDRVKTEMFLAATSIFTVGIYAAVLTRFERWGGLNVIAWDAENKSEVFISRGVRLFVTIPDLGWLMLLVFVAVAAPLVLYILARVKKEFEISGGCRSRGLHQHSVAISGPGVLSCCGCATDNIPRSTLRASTPPAWLRARSFCRRWSAESSPTCCTFCCCGGDRIWNDFCPMPTRSTASPTKPFALPSPCSP